MDAAAELGKNPVSKHQIQPEYGDEQADMGRNCRTRLARPNSQARTGTVKIHFPCPADHEQDWQPYPVDTPSCYMCHHTYIHTHTTPDGYTTLTSCRTSNGFIFEQQVVLPPRRTVMCIFPEGGVEAVDHVEAEGNQEVGEAGGGGGGK